MSGFVQNFPASGSSHSVASGANALAITPSAIGNALISVYACDSTVTLVAPTDSSGDTWTLLFTHSGGAQTMGMAYLLSCSSTASRTITWATQPANTQSISEWNGITAAGGSPVFASNASATTLTSPSYTPSQPNEIVIGALGNSGSNTNDQVQCTTAAFQTIGTLTDFGSFNCIGIQQNGGTFDSFEANGAIVTSATPFTVTWTFLANATTCAVAGFKYTPGSTGAVVAWLT